jgi:hypothetical protein
VSKGIKFLAIMALSVLISSVVAYALINFPQVNLFSIQYDEKIPKDIVSELINLQKLSFIKIGQHGYNHSYNESLEDVMMGRKILNDQSLRVEYFIPSYEIAPEYRVPSELFMIPYENGGAWYSNEKMIYGTSTVNNSKAIAIQIQNNIDANSLEEITVGRDFQYMRVDDVNTDIVDSSTQIKRLYTLVQFCDRRNCTLVIGVIPHVLRMQQSDKNYLFFNKVLTVLGVMMMMPLYIFYLISLYFKRWLM